MKKQLLPFFILILAVILFANTQKLYIDADTANEVDDLFAIVRALVEPEFDIVGLGSAQWQVSHWATPTTLEDSQRLNELLLAFLNRQDIPAPRGAEARLFDWGADVAQHSAAAYFLIHEAHKLSEGEKLTVVALGALTNIASAILIDPTIIPKIKLYLLGTSYDFENHMWRKRDFNCVMDILAVEIIMDTPALETHIVPVNTAAAMTFQMDRCQREFAGRDDVRDFLYQRWVNHIDGGRHHRTIWDLSVIELLLHPDWGEAVRIAGPPENGGRLVTVYRNLSADKMIDDFYQTLEAYFSK